MWVWSAGGVFGLFLLQPAAKTASTAIRKGRRFMCVHSMWVCRLKELPREVESHVQRVRISASRHLTERRALIVPEVQLKHVTARPLLDTESEARLARGVAGNPRASFGAHVYHRPQA